VIICFFGSVETTMPMDCQQWTSVIDLGTKEARTYKVHDIDIFSLRDERPVLSTSKRRKIVLKVGQIMDGIPEEELCIRADKKVFPYITVDPQGIDIIIGLGAPTDVEELSKKIIISVGLKKYAKLVTNGYIDTCFFSSIKADKLHIGLAAEAIIQLPLMQAHHIDIDASDCSKVTMQDKAQLVADFLSIARVGNSNVVLTVETKLLQAINNGDGKLIVDGSADEQRLDLREGSFLAFALKSDIIRMMIRNAMGEIQLYADELIKGTVSFKTQHDVTYCIHNKNSIQMHSEEDILQKFAQLLTEYSADDILRSYVWDVC